MSNDDRAGAEQPLIRDSLAIVILLLVVTAIFADVLLFGSSLVAGDLSLYHFPMKKLVRELVMSGHFPWWNRLLSGGQPIAANPAWELFYPPQWLILLPGFVFGFKLHILAHYYLAAVGMYALIRSLGMQPAAGLIAAAAFATGGPLMSMNGYLPFLFSLTWLPWTLFFALRFHRSGRTLDFAAASIAMAMQLLIGEPTVLIQSGLLLMIGALLVRRIPAVLLIVAAAVAIAAVQFIPMIDHARDSVRSIPLDYGQVSKWSSAPLRPAELFVVSRAAGVRRFLGPGTQFIGSIYLGLTVAVFALAGLVRRIRFWREAGLAIVGFYLIAIGAHTPLLGVLYRAHLFSSIRFPEKFLFGALFVLIVFAASAIDRALEGDGRLRRVALVTCSIVLGIALIAIAASPALVRATWFLPESANAASYVAVDRAEWAGSAFRALVLLVLVAAWRHRISRVALPILAIVDVIAFTAPIPARLPDRFYATPPPLLRQMPPPEYRIYHELGLQRAIKGARPLVGPVQVTQWIVRNEMLPNYPQAWGVASAMGYDADETELLVTRQFRAAFDLAIRQKDPGVPYDFMAMSNAPFTVSATSIESASREAAGDLERLTTAHVERAPIAAERYSFASRLVSCGDVEECVTRLRGQPSDIALVPESVPVRDLARGTIEAVRELPSSADVVVRTDGLAFLRISVTFHKYWTATIDGRAAPIVPSNIAYQGLFVPSGEHRIHLQYRNPLVLLGGTVTMIALVVLAILAAVRPTLVPARES